MKATRGSVLAGSPPDKGLRSGTVTRRVFLDKAGAALAGAAALRATLPGFLPRAVSAPPSEQVVVGHVGLGGRGTSLLAQTLGNRRVRVAALCDVDARHLARAAEKAAEAGERPEPGTCGDFRKLLDQEAVDAVVVATPDHWHAGVTIASCRAGKDVYVEKPLCYSVREGREMVRAAREHRRVVQVGINHRSAGYMREIVRIIQGGRIGRVRAVKHWMWENRVAQRTPPSDPPAELDWDFWLGPAPRVLFHPDRSHYNFRWCRDYAGGYMTDWGVHMLNVATFAMGVDHKGPVSVEATGAFASDNLYDFPVRMEARWEYRDPDFVMTWTQPAGGGDVLPKEKYGMTFYGEDGELRTAFGGGKRAFYRDGKEAPLPREGKEVDVPESPGHLEDWLDSIESRKPPIADVEIGHRTTLTCLIANIALFSGREKLRWDWEKEEFPGDPLANGWLERRPREAWAI